LRALLIFPIFINIKSEHYKTSKLNLFIAQSWVSLAVRGAWLGKEHIALHLIAFLIAGIQRETLLDKSQSLHMSASWWWRLVIIWD